ncbi:hypothetical protein RHSIM_Rhsim01G0165500 [Rhododendron simsii]|uniref:Uncharacterized protein n=1 Tax=Rhododendron simsii TaxID=118357 RepID=A0A834LYA6_RHOSS|nr:hypothetical protein RHSIM_Rhsim01G0165500 [Rhododendron simsii]
MDNQDTEDSSISMYNNKKPNLKIYRLVNGPNPLHPSGWFEIRLFYVRIAPCAAVESVPNHLTLRHLRREIGVSLEINGTRVPASETTSLTLRRDRIDSLSSEVTYVSTDSVKVTGAVEFEVYEEEDMVLCGSIERMEAAWSNGCVANDSRSGWSMDCYMAAAVAGGGSAFFRPRLSFGGSSCPSFEVYVAGCCSGMPVILTKTIQVSPRRKPGRNGTTLDAIPEDDEVEKEQKGSSDGLMQQRKVQETAGLRPGNEKLIMVGDRLQKQLINGSRVYLLIENWQGGYAPIFSFIFKEWACFHRLYRVVYLPQVFATAATPRVRPTRTKRYLGRFRLCHQNSPLLRLVKALDDFNDKITEAEVDDYELDGKIGSSYYPEDVYAGEDGQLSWFNAGCNLSATMQAGIDRIVEPSVLVNAESCSHDNVALDFEEPLRYILLVLNFCLKLGDEVLCC